jgi:hypothetical protein
MGTCTMGNALPQCSIQPAATCNLLQLGKARPVQGPWRDIFNSQPLAALSSAQDSRKAPGLAVSEGLRDLSGYIRA